jgi:hypothetical protein
VTKLRALVCASALPMLAMLGLAVVLLAASVHGRVWLQPGQPAVLPPPHVLQLPRTEHQLRAEQRAARRMARQVAGVRKYVADSCTHPSWRVAHRELCAQARAGHWKL